MRRTVADFERAFKNGCATPREVAERFLAAVRESDARDPPLRLFIAVDAADVRAQADEATLRHRAGRARSPLDGVPVVVKDEFDVRGYPTTCGTSVLGREPAHRDALIVARLRDAGAVIAGKTNLHELGVAPSGINVHYGTARNPYDPARETGGSSSGSAGAVSAGLAPIGLGTDSGGSIRVPAALCGVCGLKPSYGCIPSEGLALTCWSLEHPGPLAGSVEDLRLAFSMLTNVPAVLPELPAPLRLGVCARWWTGAAPEVAAIAQAALRRLPGAREVAIELAHIEQSLPAGTCIFLVEGAAACEPLLLENAPLAPSVRLSYELGRAVRATTFVKANRVRTLLLREFEQAFKNCDVVVTPTTGIVAPPYHADALTDGEADEARADQLVRFTFAGNLTGMPAATVPCGYDASGLPVGLQILAPHGQDLRALAVAAAVERVVEQRAPAVWWNLLA